MPIQKAHSKSFFFVILLIFLSSCSFGGEKVSMLHLKIGSTILGFDQMQAKDWSVAPEKLAYVGQINVRSPVKVELGRNIVLDIPYARTSLLILNTRVNDFSFVTNPKSDQSKQHEAKPLYDKLYNVLEQHPDWEFNVKLDRWMRKSDIPKRKESEESIMLSLYKDKIHLSYNADTKLSGCLSALQDHRNIFEKESIEREPDLNMRVESLTDDNTDVKLALDVIGREDPMALPLEEYVSRVNKFMEIRCPQMLETYGQ